MTLQDKVAADYKLNIFWREVVLSDNAPVRQPSPTHVDVRRRAYEIYLSQGATDGRDLDNWLQAERDLSQANGGTATARA